MEDTQNILLNSARNKLSANKNTEININLSGNKRLLPEDGIIDFLDSYEIYVNERNESNKFRLIFDIYPFCTNVLFNPFTEIIKNEGSPEVSFFNYSGDITTSRLESEVVGEDAIIAKEKNFQWNQYQAIRDTQLSDSTCDYVYHCGIDIFNNHILRSKSFKPINYNKDKSNIEAGKLDAFMASENEKIAYRDVKVNDPATPHKYLDNNFNTIDDYMRDRNGVIISEHFPKIVEKEDAKLSYNLKNIVMPLHLYQEYDIRSFEECVKDKLVEQNGWYGFVNPSTISTITKNDDESTELGINRTINNRLYCDFIDMYPGRELYSFTPKYNFFKKRIEKNWNYCLTYPSKSVIMNSYYEYFPFFNIDVFGNTSLKVYMIDEGTVDDNGVAVLTVYSICQHGLTVGDTVNIYKRTVVGFDEFDDLFYDGVEVINVIDKYTFQVTKSDANMSDMWIEVKDRNVQKEVENPVEPGDEIIFGMYKTKGKYYPICASNRCNIDPNAQNIHFRRVVNGVECKYYVRKFSRIPNFKFKDEEINDYTLYDDNFVEKHKKIRNSNIPLTLIERFSKPGNPNNVNKNDWPVEFENHIAKLGFSNTSFSDDVSEIVFTDDIDLSYLKDNLGRPLSDIYLTFVKNNMGYKDWYGINGKSITINDNSIEYSHCFGKVNSSFLLSEYYRESYNNAPVQSTLYDVRDLTADASRTKALMTETKLVTKDENAYDEVDFYRDWEYYGDICCYSPVDCDEQSIQMAMHRFNTAQRELSSKDTAYAKFNNGTMYHDEIKDTENNLPFEKTNDGDPYNDFKSGALKHTTKEEYENMTTLAEGYYYQPHYKIMAKMVSKSLSSDTAIQYEIVEVKNAGTNQQGRKMFEIKTGTENDFLKNEKLVLYDRVKNTFYYMTVDSLITSFRFKCVIAYENGTHTNDIPNLLDIEHIDDFVILKKRDGIPSYAKLIKDGSCRYYWRNIVPVGTEDVGKAYPFTNGAFYITKQINFFLRRQDPKQEYLSITTSADYNYTPDGERIDKYYNFGFDTNYTEDEMDDCAKW